jgi:His-Xaa-Ser system radical SAM maturase HxsC
LIDLKLKAEFGFSQDPFLLKLKESGKDLLLEVGDKEIGVFTRELNYLEVQAIQGSFKIFFQSDDMFHGDVILCIPEASRIQRLFRANSTNNTFLFTERCDQMCAMCSQPPRSSIDEWRFPHFQKTIELSDPDSIIGISGGEPTLYKDALFSILLNTIEKRPDVKIHILTNGQHFDDGDLNTLKVINESLEILWGIPLYSYDSANHDEIVGKKGAFKVLMENLFKVGSAKTAIELRTVLTKKNALDLPELANFISKHIPFISKWVIMAMEPIGFAKANKDELFFDHSDAKFPVQNALDVANLNGLTVQLYNFPLCTVDETYRKYCTKSISDWKNKYLDECSGCSQQNSCCGFFEWYTEDWKWTQIKAII